MSRFNFTSFFYVITCAALLVVSCQGLKQQENAVQDASFVNGSLVFLGVSPRLSNHDNAIQNALTDAARRFSFFDSVSGTVTRREQAGGNAMNFLADKNYALQYDKDLEKYKDRLEIIKTFENNNAVFVVARADTANISVPRYMGHSYAKQRPKWVDTPPVISGHIVYVGHSGFLSSHADAVIRSYENAVTGIIESITTQIINTQNNYLNSYSAFGFEITSTTATNASCTLRNFYIVESWTDPATNNVWTLAVSRGD
ncbi:MAG: hypothetical protein FWD26_07650 [Treponema sp.]|nr:hypothetical protein [Treponema sp.]